MNSQAYILDKLKLNFDEQTHLPIEIPNFGREGLAKLFAELDFKTGAEIGVREGEFSEVLCKNNPELKLFGVDPFTAYSGYGENIGGESFDEHHRVAKIRLSPYNFYFVKKFSQAVLRDFEDESLDFVYIDGNHDFENCTNDIVGWSTKVKQGGIISGHDYTKHSRPTRIHCYQVVNGYSSSYSIKPWFTTSSRFTRGDQTLIEARSWFWVKKPFRVPRRNSV